MLIPQGGQGMDRTGKDRQVEAGFGRACNGVDGKVYTRQGSPACNRAGEI